MRDFSKRPLNAYFLFAADIHSNLIRDNPTLGIIGISRLTSQAWANLSVEDKSRYEEEAFKCKEEYNKARAALHIRR